METYVDRDGKKHEYIYLLEEDVNEYPKGWYFSDETEQLNGPFGTLEEAEKIFIAYCERLG